MNITDEFYKFCQGLNQDSFELYGPDPQNWIKEALEFVNNDRLPLLRDYLVELLTGDYTDAELNEIYSSTETEIRIQGNKGVRPFLEDVLEIIDDGL